MAYPECLAGGQNRKRWAVNALTYYIALFLPLLLHAYLGHVGLNCIVAAPQQIQGQGIRLGLDAPA
jgi:hypothetical protein